MEEIKDFDEWAESFKKHDPVFMASYDKSTGQVLSIGPSHAFAGQIDCVVVDRELAELVLEGKVAISSCVIDMQNNTMEIAEVKSIFKIDDVLHRVVDIEYANIDNPDLIITYSKQNKSLQFSLSEEYNGARRILWDGETVMNFLITDYNDPNILFNMLSLKIADLVGKSVTVENLDMPPKFSVYTRRLFKNYVIESK